MSGPNERQAAPPVEAGAGPGFLEGVFVITRRELSAYFDSPIAYVYTIAFALLANSIFMNEFFLAGRAEMTPLFEALPLLLVFFLPAVTMRLWAEEAQKRTVELLLTLPIRPIQAVLAKYLAAVGLFGLFLATSLPIPIMLAALGEPDLGRILSGYLALSLFGLGFLALGMFTSALTSDQIIAFVLATVAGFLLVLTGDDRVVTVLDGLAPNAALGSLLYEHLSALPPYERMVGGLIEPAAILYFVALAAVFLVANAVLLQVRRG